MLEQQRRVWGAKPPTRWCVFFCRGPPFYPCLAPPPPPFKKVLRPPLPNTLPCLDFGRPRWIQNWEILTQFKWSIASWQEEVSIIAKMRPIFYEHTALSHEKLFTTAAVGTPVPPWGNIPCGLIKIVLISTLFWLFLLVRIWFWTHHQWQLGRLGLQMETTCGLLFSSCVWRS